MESKKNIVVLFTDWFYPAFKAGGPIRSTTNFVDLLHSYLDLKVITSNTDFGEVLPLQIEKSDDWLLYKEAQIIYLSRRIQTFTKIKQLLFSINPQFIYLNSMFSPVFTLLPLVISSVTKINCKIILSPRGMLKPSALKIKPLKKNIFLKLFKLFKYHKKVIFLATDMQEYKNIVNAFGKQTQVKIINNIPCLPQNFVKITKKENTLKMIFIGRIHPIKNLDFLLILLKKLKNIFISLTICGPVENESYWNICQQIITLLPRNISVNYVGQLHNHLIVKKLEENHFLILPTLGENFGHAIFEALAAGRPIIVSDQTPWRNLQEKKIGWDIPLNKSEKFVEAIETAAQMNQEKYDILSKSAWQFAKDYVENSNLKEQYLKLFS